MTKEDKFNKESFLLINHVISIQKPYGYCHFKEHRGYISKANFKTHECAKKHCHYFEVNPSHAGAVETIIKKESENKNDMKQLRKDYLSGTMTLQEYNLAKEKLLRKAKSKRSSKKNTCKIAV